MSQTLSEDIRECRIRADEFKQKASIERDPVLRCEHLEFERRWRTLARGYELADRLDQLGNPEFPVSPTKSAA